MQKYFIFSLMLTASRLYAGEVPAPEGSGDDTSVSGRPGDHEIRQLNAKEQRGADLAKQWIDKKSLPVREDDGKIVYLFGSTLPSIICSPLSLCDIELQVGEKIKDVYVGDTPRWKVRPALSGSGSSETTHVIVKPTDTGITTTMVVTTDRRTYHIKLLSRHQGWMPRVGFTYPSDIEREWQKYYAQEGAKNERNTMPETHENVEGLDFEYDISGSTPWKPVRVYNDSVKTIIQMPREMSQTEAPALLVVGATGTQQIVNYRLKRDRYIVDQIFAKAVLIAGVGSDQTSVTIEHTKGQAKRATNVGGGQ